MIIQKKYIFEILREDIRLVEPILLKNWSCEHKYFSIKHGIINVNKGYAWDGCTGGLIENDDTNIRASLFHDILSQAMREGLIKANYSNRKRIDKIFRKILKEDGMRLIKRSICYIAVRLAGWAFTYF